jgi:thiamine biosynthesis lipoprotein
MKKSVCYIFLSVFLAALNSCAPQKDNYVSIQGYAQGGVYSVTLNLKGVDVPAEEIRDSIDAILAEIDVTLSGYNKNSMLSRFNAGEDVIPNELFLDSYDLGYRIYQETQGGVDVACAPLFDIWGFGFKTGELPSDEVVSHVKKTSGLGRCWASIQDYAGMNLNAENLLLERETVLPQLNYNAIAQGYSCDLVAKYLYSIGVKDMLVNIGEIFCDGKNPSGQAWTVGIDRPVDGNNELGAQLQGVFKVPAGPHGVVTSGNYRKFYIKDGKKYAHTIDPRTGYPVDHSLLSATVIAPDAMTADAYATYCMVVGLEASKAFFAGRTDMEACLIYDEGGEFRTLCTPGFLLEE